MPESQDTLIIGYGNSLRQDDGVGFRVAEQIADWNWPRVRALACHQLTPELAADMALCQRVVFIDAAPLATLPSADVCWLRLDHSAPETWTAHRLTPRSLLALTQILYNTTPEAHWLLIPAIEFAFGDELSSITTIAMQTALSLLSDWYGAGFPDRQPDAFRLNHNSSAHPPQGKPTTP